jgi:hypothetical protein
MRVERKMLMVTAQATRFMGGYDYNELKWQNQCCVQGIKEWGGL